MIDEEERTGRASAGNAQLWGRWRGIRGRAFFTESRWPAWTLSGAGHGHEHTAGPILRTLFALEHAQSRPADLRHIFSVYRRAIHRLMGRFLIVQDERVVLTF